MQAEARAPLLHGKRTQFKTYLHRGKGVCEEITKNSLPLSMLAEVRFFAVHKKVSAKMISTVKDFLPQE
jgi:hypothetical protein